MAQTVNLWGATYSNVPALLVPSGNGIARFDDASVTTATAADVASGKVFLASNGAITTGTASGGGGGASNIVTGTFKGTTTNAALSVTIPYTGTGFPVAIEIYPTGGTSQTASLVQRYAIVFASVAKYNANTPDYSNSGDNSNASSMIMYKSSATSSSSYSASASLGQRFYRTGSATSGNNTYIRINSNKSMSVFIAGTSYGFAANTEYTYCVIYSS